MREQKGVSGAKWTSPDKFHITIGYFGDVDADKAEVLDNELAQLKMGSFMASVYGAGHFGSAEPHSIWMGVPPSEELTRLHKHCRRSARYAKIDMETRAFRPHITMAYLKKEPRIDRIINFEKRLAHFKAGPFLVDEFFLFSSWPTKSGPNIYRQEASYPLLG